MTSALEDELVEAYEREVQKLVSTERKYRAVLGGAEIDTIVRAFRFTFEHGVDKVTAQMLYDMINDVSGE
jgi:hypothetical protein